MIRCIHTHPKGIGQLSDVDISALISLCFDAISAVGVTDRGQPTSIQTAFLDESGDTGVLRTEVIHAQNIPNAEWMQTIEETDSAFVAKNPETNVEKAVLVGIESEESLKELYALTLSAGAEPVEMVLQKRQKPDSLFCIGRGKAEELALKCQAMQADVVIFDEVLSGVAQKNLEEMLRLKVIDRTALILDIFASRANTREGKLQVEVAQLEYRSRRLLGQGLILSRLGGGIGTRGPGESKLEVNRRRIRERLAELTRELDQVEKQRRLRRKRRERNQTPLVVLVGYTNVGKSTLFNYITGANVFVQEQLFATLDSVSRPIFLPHGNKILLIDTVGFIRKLPHELIKAFHATLEEAALADIVVMVSDASNPEMLVQHATVLGVLESLGATNALRLDVVNKCDLCALETTEPDMLPGAIRICAKTGYGVEGLLAQIEMKLEAKLQTVTMLVPFAKHSILSRLYKAGSVISQEYVDKGTIITVRMEQQHIKKAYTEGCIHVSDENNTEEHG